MIKPNPIFYFLSAIFIHAGVSAQSEKLFNRWDKNKDGFLTPNEVPEGTRRTFERKDSNGDGKVSLKEHMRQDRGKLNSSPGPASFMIRQTWSQAPDGFDRPVHVVEPKLKDKKVPVVIYLHGNGGDASRSIKQWAKQFPNSLVVAPQGYSKSWNIQGEKSKAPDVSFFESLIAEIGKRYIYANMHKVSLIGSSNGGGYIYRLLIESKPGLFQKAVVKVASLLEVEYRENSFWKSTDESDTSELDEKVATLSNTPRILYIHGTKDAVVPFEGGLRSKKFRHHSAQTTANALAKALGYTGEVLQLRDGKDLGNGLIIQKYRGDKNDLVFVAVKDGNHGLAPHRDVVNEMIVKFVNHR